MLRLKSNRKGRTKLRELVPKTLFLKYSAFYVQHVFQQRIPTCKIIRSPCNILIKRSFFINKRKKEKKTTLLHYLTMLHFLSGKLCVLYNEYGKKEMTKLYIIIKSTLSVNLQLNTPFP